MSGSIPNEVLWSASVGGAVIAIGIARIVVLGEFAKARGIDKLLLLGSIFYAAPLAAFGTEHFTFTDAIVSLIPSWIPWPEFWAYAIGACFIAAAFSMVTGILAGWSASAVAVTFFLFVVTMDVPAWLEDPHERLPFVLSLRELSFCAGALALAATSLARPPPLLATLARFFIAIAIVIYSVQQFLHGDHVPAIPLALETPSYVVGHGIWTYATAVVYAIAGVILLVGWKPRAAATALGINVLFVVLVVYVQIVVGEHVSVVSFNYITDTLMFGGALLLLAAAQPRS